MMLGNGLAVANDWGKEGELASRGLYRTSGNASLSHRRNTRSYRSNANGVVTANTYDALGRVLTVTVQHPSNPALHAVTTMAYDAVGNVTGITLPSTDTLVMDYDAAGRLVTLRAASGERQDFAYDAMGNVTRETVKRADGSTSRQIARAFDELGRLIRVFTRPGSTARLGYARST